MLTRRVPGSEASGATKRVSVLTSVSQKVKSKCAAAALLSLFLKICIRQVGQETGTEKRCIIGKL